MSNMPRQTEPQYQDGFRCDEWEVVVPELVFEAEAWNSLPASPVVPGPIACKRITRVTWSRPIPPHKGAMYPVCDSGRCPGIRPMVDQRIRVLSLPIVCQARRHEAGVKLLLAIIGVIGEYNAHQSTPGVSPGFPDTRTDFPVHVLPLPGARPNKHNGGCGVSNILVANLLSHGRAAFRSVSTMFPVSTDLLHYARSHSAGKLLFVLDVLFVETYENFVSGYSGHHIDAPAYSIKYRANKTVTTTAI